jgi:hypothetical protein
MGWAVRRERRKKREEERRKRQREERDGKERKRRKREEKKKEKKKKRNEVNWAVDQLTSPLTKACRPKPTSKLLRTPIKAQGPNPIQIGPPMSIQAQSDLGFPNIQRA